MEAGDDIIMVGLSWWDYHGGIIMVGRRGEIHFAQIGKHYIPKRVTYMDPHELANQSSSSREISYPQPRKSHRVQSRNAALR